MPNTEQHVDAEVRAAVEVKLHTPATLPDSRASATAPLPVKALGFEGVWAAGYRGRGVRIGLLDSGVNFLHPDLRAGVASWIDIDHDGSWRMVDSPHDASGHGTHCAGLLIGGSHDGQPIGMAPDAKLFVGRVLEGGPAILRLLSGLAWMKSQRVDVLCLPLGIDGHNTVLWPMIDAILSGGTLIVAAAGNSGASMLQAPASYPGVLAARCLDLRGQLASFSRATMGLARQTKSADVSGISILSHDGFSTGYARRSGTSQAAAIVAGIGAVLLGADTKRSRLAVSELLVRATQNISNPDEDYGQENRTGTGSFRAGPVFPGCLERKSEKSESADGTAKSSMVAPLRAKIRCDAERLHAEADEWRANTMASYRDPQLIAWLSEPYGPPRIRWIVAAAREQTRRCEERVHELLHRHGCMLVWHGGEVANWVIEGTRNDLESIWFAPEVTAISAIDVPTASIFGCG